MDPRLKVIRPLASPGKKQQPHQRPVDSDALRFVENFSRYLDSKFVIPGTKIRFGFDPIFSLFPVFGDILTYIISGSLIYTMHRHGASRKVVIKMIMNSTLDAVIGAIPLIGTLFDVFYRSNDRNVRLLREHYYEGKHQGSGNGLLLIVAIAAILIVVGAVYGVWKLMEWIF